MAWPLSQDYNEALQNPHTSFSDPDLRQGQVVTNVLGIPQPCTGNFADVYAIECPANRTKWAVKCFTREIPGLRERYAEISSHLRQAHLPFAVEFQYLEQGVRIGGRWYPILKMQWVEGFTLNAFLREHVDKPTTLDALTRIWLRMAERLGKANLAHGDLQHGNVMLVPGREAQSLAVKLIDYDGMWVPALARTPSGELGHPSYQHPRRIRENIYSAAVDRFPLLAIATALRCLCVGGRALWDRYTTGDNLLFRESDFQAPVKSRLFAELLRLPDPVARQLVEHTLTALKGPLEAVPPLEQLLPDLPVYVPPTAVASVPMAHGAAAPPLAAPVLAAPKSATVRLQRSDTLAGMIAPTMRSGVGGRRRRQKSKAGLVVACLVAILAVVGGTVGYLTLGRADQPGEPQLAAAHNAHPPKGAHKPDAPARERGSKPGEKAKPKTGHKPDAPARGPRTRPGEKVKPKPPVTAPPRTKVRPTLPVAMVGPPEPKKKPTPTPAPPPPPPPPLDAAGMKAEAALKPLRERLKMGGAVPDALRQKLYTFRFEHPGTPAAYEAARLLAALPSPLDKLEAERIPESERLPWQPDKLVAVLGEHRGRHGAYVQCVVCSNDGKFVVSGGTGLTHIWDAATLTMRSTLPYEGGAVLSLALSRDGNTLVVGGMLGEATGSAQVWDVKDKTMPVKRFTIPAPGTPVRAVALHPGGKTLAIGCLDGSVRLYDISGETEKLLTRFEANAGGVVALAYTPDGSRLASGGSDNKVRLWGMEDDGKAKERAALDGGGTVMALAISPDGKKLASGGKGLSLRVWALPAKDKARPRILKMKEGWVTALSFSKNGKQLAAAANGRPNAHGTVELWTLGPADKRISLKGHLSFVFAVAFAPDGKTLFSGGNDWTVRAWDVTKPRPVERFKPGGHLSLVRAAAFSPDGKSLISGGEDNTVRLWDLTRAPLKPRILVPESATPVQNVIRAVAWSPDGLSMAAGDAKGLVRQWDAGGRGKQALRPHPAAVDALAYLPNGQQLLAASDRIVILWDAKQGREVRRFKGHETPIHSMALSPDGHRVLTGAGAPFPLRKPPYADATLRLWDVDEGKELYPVKSPTPLASVAFAADGRHAFSGAIENKVRRWDLSGPHAVEEKALPGETPFAFRLQPTPDGRRLVAFGLDGKLIVWDLTTGERLWHWQFPEVVGDVALSPEGRHVAVTLATGVIYILRLAEREADKEKDS